MTYPGYEQFSTDLSTLLTTYSPPFIYIHDPESFKSTCAVVHSILQDISASPSSFIIHSTRIDAVSTFTNRLLFEALINSLAGWKVNWQDGCSNWLSNLDQDEEGEKKELRWNENMDTFIHGLRAVHEYLCRQDKGKEHHSTRRLVIVIERAERLKETNPELVVPLTRLAEIARLDIVVIFISQVGWEGIRPSLGASPDPYYMDIPPPSKENIVKYLIHSFTSLSQSLQIHTPTQQPPTTPYHPSLAPLYTHFITLLIDICFPFIHNPQELQYIAAARWPGFVKPVLDDYEHGRADGDIDMDTDDEQDKSATTFTLPSEHTRMRLNRLFNSSFTNALEALHPRLSNATDWAQSNKPDDDLLSKPPAQQQQQLHSTSNAHSSSTLGMNTLPRISKFILVASFVASTNPAKSDIRMFGRGLDEKKRKRRIRKVGQSGRTGTAAAKVPQRLLGPLAFALDRMIAILGALLEENDIDDRVIPHQFSIPGEFTDMEITRVGVFSAIMELTSMRLLHRTSPTDKLDGPPMFKCAISYDATLALAKQLRIPLNDLLWDPM